MGKLFKLRHVKTEVIDQGADHIIKQLFAIGNGKTIECGILPKDFDKMADTSDPKMSKVPVGVYAAYNIFGDSRGKNSPPKRDFMTPSFDESVNQVLHRSKNGFKKIIQPGSVYNIDDLLKEISEYVKHKMKRRIRYFGGSNSDWWLYYKKLKKLNLNVLRATDTMLNSIDTRVVNETSPEVSRPNIVKAFKYSYEKNIKKMKNLGVQWNSKVDSR